MNQLENLITEDSLDMEVINEDKEEALFGRFIISGKLKDDKEFRIYGRWDIGGHPSDFHLTRFSKTKDKLTSKEKNALVNALENNFDNDEGILMKLFNDNLGYALESDD